VNTPLANSNISSMFGLSNTIDSNGRDSSAIVLAIPPIIEFFQ
jgi:hypothetical protein